MDEDLGYNPCMSTFHDDKLWQEAYTALLDLFEVTNSGSDDLTDQIRKHAMMVLTEVAQAVANRDRKFRDMKLRGVVSIIAALRSLLSVAWAQEAFDDDTFAKLDGAYEALSNKLPR